MKRLISLLVLAVLLLPLTADAFDGNRKGFVFGGGLGFAPTASWKAKNTSADENKFGQALHILLGYSIDDRNMIVYEANAVGFESNFYNDELVLIGSRSLALYHYFGESSRHPFLMGGFGFHFINMCGNDPGFGLLLGGGYEFMRHLQVGAYVSAGNSSVPGPAIDYSHTYVSIVITAVAF